MTDLLDAFANIGLAIPLAAAIYHAIFHAWPEPFHSWFGGDNDD